MNLEEQHLHQYLDNQGVYTGQPEMQDIVINTFYTADGRNNDDDWERKVQFVYEYFAPFHDYVGQNWSSIVEPEPNDSKELENVDDDLGRSNAEINQVIDLTAIAETTDAYKNLPVAVANDHVVRLSVMTEPYFWHYHPNSEEVFIVLEGILIIEMEDRTVELQPRQLFTVNRNTPHRTRPKDNRSVNLTISAAYAETERIMVER